MNIGRLSVALYAAYRTGKTDRPQTLFLVDRKKRVGKGRLSKGDVIHVIDLDSGAMSELEEFPELARLCPPQEASDLLKSMSFQRAKAYLTSMFFVIETNPNHFMLSDVREPKSVVPTESEPTCVKRPRRGASRKNQERRKKTEKGYRSMIGIVPTTEESLPCGSAVPESYPEPEKISDADALWLEAMRVVLSADIEALRSIVVNRGGPASTKANALLREKRSDLEEIDRRLDDYRQQREETKAFSSALDSCKGGASPTSGDPEHVYGPTVRRNPYSEWAPLFECRNPFDAYRFALISILAGLEVRLAECRRLSVSSIADRVSRYASVLGSLIELNGLKADLMNQVRTLVEMFATRDVDDPLRREAEAVLELAGKLFPGTPG